MSEMSDDELRARLTRLDPASAGTTEPLTSPRARELVERIMQTSETPQTLPATERGPQSIDRPIDLVAARRRRRPWLLGLAAAVFLVALVGTVLATAGGGRIGDTPGGGDPTTLALELPPSDAAGSCLVFDVQFLAGMPVAFAGTATAVEDGQVTIEVDRWYRGGDSDLVTLGTPDGQSSAVFDGVAFQEGERYLVTATDGMVNGCGFSGPAAPQLEQAFEEAFAG